MPASNAAGIPTPASTIRLLERLAYQIGVTVHSHQAEPIHDLRVAIRRFQQGLALFKHQFDRRASKKIKRHLKDLLDLSSAVRDADIATKILTKSGLPGATRIKTRISTQRKEYLARLVTALRRWGAHNTCSKWRDLLTVDDSSSPHPNGRLTKMAKQFLADGDEMAGGKPGAAELHAYRIESKKFRYALEIFQPVYGAAAKEWLARLKKVQSLLGDVHDYHAVRQEVQEFGGDTELEAWLKKKERRRTREFRKLWQEEFSDSAARRQWVAGLRHPARKPMARSAGSATSASARTA